jgi:uncharacterized protein involved in outer membrane biogenesis
LKAHTVRRVIVAAAAAAMIVIAVAAASAYWLFSRDGFRRALEAQATSWIGVPVRIGAARATFLPRIAVQLRDIRVGDPARLSLATVELAADLRPLLGGRIENADVLVSDSRIDMPLPFSLPEPANAGASAVPAAPVRIVSIRSIALRDVRLRSRDREIVVSADSTLDDTTLAIRRFDAGSGRTALAVEGVVALSPRIDAQLHAAANRLDLDELVALVAAFTPDSTGKDRRDGPGSGPRIAAGISAGEATAGAVRMQQFKTELTLDGDAIVLNRLGFEMFGGRYEGSVAARLDSPLSARLESRIADLDAAQLATFGGVADTITGRLSGAGTFTGSGADVTELLRNARGNGTAAIVDGSIRRLHLVRTVVLFFGRPAPDAGDATDRFDRLDVTFSLANRVLRAQTLSLQSADADMVGTGSLSLATDALDGRVDVMLSEKLSAQAGTDLYRYTREGNRVVLPASIGGTLPAPRLTIDAGAAVKRGLRNEIERRMKDLFEGVGRR